MFALGQETDEHVVVDPVLAKAASSAAELRDQLFEENQGTAVKAIAVVLVGLYVVYRFLFKR